MMLNIPLFLSMMPQDLPDDPMAMLNVDYVCENYAKDVPLYPCAVINCGSAASVMKVMQTTANYE